MNLPNHYPFCFANKVLIGSDQYSKILCMDGNILKFNTYLKQLGHFCLCCESITCSNKWTPQHNLLMVLVEIVHNIELRKRIREKYYADKVTFLWTPWKKYDHKGKEIEDPNRMLSQQFIPDDLRIRDWL